MAFKRGWSALALLGLGAFGLSAFSGCTGGLPSDTGNNTQSAGLPGGFVFIVGDDADDSGHCQGTACGGLYVNMLRQAVSQSRSGGTGILAIGVNNSNALTGLSSWNNTANGGPGAVVTRLLDPTQIGTVDFAQYAVVYVPSDRINTSGGITEAQATALNARRADLVRFVNEQGGSLVVLTQSAQPAAIRYGFLPVALTVQIQDYSDVTATAQLLSFSSSSNNTNLDHGYYHNSFTGPAGFSGLSVLAWRTEPAGVAPYRAAILGGRSTVLTAEICDNMNDDDGDGRVDGADPECHVCGNGTIDQAIEACDDGNNVDGDGCSARCELENRPPVARCRNLDVANDTGVCGASVNVNNGSSDPDGDTLTYTQSPANPLPVGTTTVTLRVSDGTSSSTCTATVTVRDAEAPAITCPTIPDVECTAGSANYTLPAATAADNCTTVSVSTPSSGPYAVGSHSISYTATDPAGNASSCTSELRVVDTTAPAATVAPTLTVWPPNHKHRTYSITDCIRAVSDTCGGSISPASGQIVSMSSDEPENDGGDGSTSADMAIVSATQFRVRAERSGGGNGRVYRVNVRYTDGSGNATIATCTLGVPQELDGPAAVDDGPTGGYSIP